MAATKAIKAKGTTLSFAIDGAGGQPVLLTAVRTITRGGSKLGFTDVTNMDSTGNYKEQIPNIFDAGDITVEGVYTAGGAGYEAALTSFNNQDLCDFIIQAPKGPGQATAGDSWTFQGYFGSEGTTYDYSKEITYSITITITGPVTPVAGS